MAYYSIFVILSLAITALAVDNSTNHIFEPSGITDVGTNDQNRYYVVGRDYPISWATSTELAYVVALWQVVPGAGYANDILNVFSTDYSPGSNSVNWTCETGNANLQTSNIFYMEVRSDDVAISSHYFNITQGNKISSIPTSALASSITTASATSSAASTSSPSSSATSSASATPSASAAANSTTMKIGLGVGLGVGIPLVLIIAVWAGFSIFRRRAAGRDDGVPPPVWHEEATPYAAGVYAPMAQTQPYVYAAPVAHEKSNEVAIQEVGTDREPVELPSESKRRSTVIDVV